MSTATRSCSLRRGLTTAGLPQRPPLIRTSPDRHGLAVTADSREALLAAIIEYCAEETHGLQERPLAWRITNEHVGPTDAWNEARTA